MKLKGFDFRIWDKGEETLTYASKDWKLSIGFSNPQQDNGETESVLHAYYDGESIRVMTSSYFLNECEVIGNIHENADLLDGVE